MRFAAYNILDGGTGRADPLAEVLIAQRADVIVLSEAQDDEVTDRIARRLGMDCVIGHGNGDGVAILTRFTIASSVNHAAVTPGAPRALLEAHIDSPIGRIVVFGLHLSPQATFEQERVRFAEMQVVLAQTKELRNGQLPHVLAGDFNANSPHQIINLTKAKQSTRQAAEAQGGEIPRDVVGLIERTGYLDTLRDHDAALGQHETTFATHEPGQRVDYIFSFGLTTRSAWVEKDRLATFASDHYPVGAELEWSK